MLVLPVAQPKHAKADALQQVTLVAGLGGAAQPLPKLGGRVGGIAVAVRGHQQEHEALAWQLRRRGVLLNVQRLKGGAAAVPPLQLRTQRLCKPLRRARLRAKQDDAAVTRIRSLRKGVDGDVMGGMSDGG